MVFSGPEDNVIEKKLDKFKKNVEISTKKYETLVEKLNRIALINKKLSNGFSVSMKVIVDISALLRQYTELFDQMELLLNKIDDKNTLDTIDIQYMNNVTKQTIERLTVDFEKHIGAIVKTYEQNGKSKEDRDNLQLLKNLSSEITTPTNLPSTQNFTTNGGKKQSSRIKKNKSNNKTSTK